MIGDLKGIDVDYDLGDDDKEGSSHVDQSESKAKSQKGKEKSVSVIF